VDDLEDEDANLVGRDYQEELLELFGRKLFGWKQYVWRRSFVSGD
jgi:hypothetical protein